MRAALIIPSMSVNFPRDEFLSGYRFLGLSGLGQRVAQGEPFDSLRTRSM